MLNTRAPVMNRPKQSWRYGGAWDIDDPYVPMLAMAPPVIVLDHNKDVAPKKSRSKSWLLVFAGLIIAYAVYSNYKNNNL